MIVIRILCHIIPISFVHSFCYSVVLVASPPLIELRSEIAPTSFGYFTHRCIDSNNCVPNIVPFLNNYLAYNKSYNTDETHRENNG